MELQQFTDLLVAGLKDADALGPVPPPSRTGTIYQAGIGAHSEHRMVEFALAAVSSRLNGVTVETRVLYPRSGRIKCDVRLTGGTDWAIEMKLLRRLGDNGKSNDNILMHILSPYKQDRSAVTDCVKLAQSGFTARQAVMIIGFEYPEWPLEPAVKAFERIASDLVNLRPCAPARFSGLVHPVQREGAVFAWEIIGARSAFL
jgi:hypothetical protein